MLDSKSLMSLLELVAHLRESLGIRHKQDIQAAARGLGLDQTTGIQVGDDCAAIPDGDGYLLLAAEGMLPALVESDPWFAGWCAVMVNVSDIYSMGGRPLAVVDTIWSQPGSERDLVWAGMKAAAEAYQVPIVGGHTNSHSPYNAVSVAILGRANRLISSFEAQPGDQLVIVANFRGQSHPNYPFWNAATEADPVELRQDLEVLPQLAEKNLCKTGKDISMGGIIGTTLMMLETSGCGAVLQLDRIPYPSALSLENWLLAFPSYGFLLSISPENVATVRSLFQARALICEVIGEIESGHQLILNSGTESLLFWDFAQESLTGLGTEIKQK